MILRSIFDHKIFFSQTLVPKKQDGDLKKEFYSSWVARETHSGAS